MKVLISNLDKIHTTPGGITRIRKNLNLDSNVDIIEFCKNIIKDPNSLIYKNGKNYYCNNDNIILTINSYNFCIITAHFAK